MYKSSVSISISISEDFWSSFSRCLFVCQATSRALEAQFAALQQSEQERSEALFGAASKCGFLTSKMVNCLFPRFPFSQRFIIRCSKLDVIRMIVTQLFLTLTSAVWYVTTYPLKKLKISVGWIGDAPYPELPHLSAGTKLWEAVVV